MSHLDYIVLALYYNHARGGISACRSASYPRKSGEAILPHEIHARRAKNGKDLTFSLVQGEILVDTPRHDTVQCKREHPGNGGNDNVFTCNSAFPLHGLSWDSQKHQITQATLGSSGSLVSPKGFSVLGAMSISARSAMPCPQFFSRKIETLSEHCLVSPMWATIAAQELLRPSR